MEANLGQLESEKSRGSQLEAPQNPKPVTLPPRKHRSYDNTSSYQIISTDNNNHHNHHLQLGGPLVARKSPTFVCGVGEHRASQVSQSLQPDKSLIMYEDSTFNTTSHTRASYAYSENDDGDEAVMIDLDEIATSLQQEAEIKRDKKISFREREKCWCIYGPS